jgi:hypothetical protein
MRRFFTMLAVAVGMVTGACSHRVARESGGDVDIGSRTMRSEDWGGDIRGIGGWSRIRGSAYAIQNEKGTVVTVTINHGVAGAAYGWEILEGKCGSAGRKAAETTTFPPVYVEDSGYGAAIATLKTRLDPGKEYFINLYMAAEQRTGIVACGKLAP